MIDRRQATFAAVFGLTLAVTGAPAPAAADDIVDTAAASGQFDILVGALEDTGLDEVLRGPGPFTVFAPTDAAFEDLPDNEQRLLLAPQNRDRLTKLLSFHVVKGEVPAAQIVGRAVIVNTAADMPLAIDGTADPVNVGGAPLIQADIEADNGVIHVVGEVVVPPEFTR